VQAVGAPDRMDRFVLLLNEQIARCLHNGIIVETRLFRSERFLEVTVHSAEESAARDAVAEAASRYIVGELEQDVLRGLIAREYGYDEPEELAMIEVYCRHNADPTQEQRQLTDQDMRRSLVYEEIVDYLRTNRLLNMEGLVRFRLKRYHEQLRDIVEYAIDEYTADRQYEEFISLLKYFVYIQEVKIPSAHLIHKGDHEFSLLNERMEPIEVKQPDPFVIDMIDREINFEDMIVSALISVSPQKLVIHTRHPESQVIKTIRHIFEDRASVCTACPRCRPLLGECKHVKS